MKFKKALLATTASLALSASFASLANSDVSNAQDKLTNAWTQCGIGAMIFKDLPVGAAISNVIWDLGTTAVISMAASPDTCKGVNVAAASFINESLDSIESDIAKGEGRHAVAMLALMGCREENHSTVTSAIRQELAQDENYTSLSRTEKAQKVYATAEKQVASCKVS